MLFDGTPIGVLRVAERTLIKIWGTFHPGPRFEECRAVFDEADRWSRQLDEAEPFAIEHDRSVEVTLRS